MSERDDPHRELVNPLRVWPRGAGPRTFRSCKVCGSSLPADALFCVTCGGAQQDAKPSEPTIPPTIDLLHDIAEPGPAGPKPASGDESIPDEFKKQIEAENEQLARDWTPSDDMPKDDPNADSQGPADASEEDRSNRPPGDTAGSDPGAGKTAQGQPRGDDSGVDLSGWKSPYDTLPGEPTLPGGAIPGVPESLLAIDEPGTVPYAPPLQPGVRLPDVSQTPPKFDPDLGGRIELGDEWLQPAGPGADTNVEQPPLPDAEDIHTPPPPRTSTDPI